MKDFSKRVVTFCETAVYKHEQSVFHFNVLPLTFDSITKKLEYSTHDHFESNLPLNYENDVVELQLLEHQISRVLAEKDERLGGTNKKKLIDIWNSPVV